jgi:hypothetical protein
VSQLSVDGDGTAARLIPDRPSLKKLREAAAGCKACPLWEHATQTVFGEGSADADVIFVGEQPGDREDLEGRPFVGPAGRLLDHALEEAGIDRSKVYSRALSNISSGSPRASDGSTRSRTGARSPPAALGSTPRSPC